MRDYKTATLKNLTPISCLVCGCMIAYRCEHSIEEWVQVRRLLRIREALQAFYRIHTEGTAR